jgi:hypothetical protein
MNVDRERIRKQSKEVATYMMKPKKYHVEWDCPHCGNSHNWWWEEEFEAYDDGPTLMSCDRCDTQTWCKGDGNGFYEPVGKVVIDPDKSEVLEQRVSDLESLELDLHNYVRGFEDKVNTNNKLAFDAINTLTMRLIELENTVAGQRSELDNLGRRTTQAELAVWRLENDIKVPGSAKLGPQHIALAKEMEKSENAEIKMGMWGATPIEPKPEIGDLNIRGDGDHTLRVFNGKEWIPAMQDLDTSLDERILKQLNEQHAD